MKRSTLSLAMIFSTVLAGCGSDAGTPDYGADPALPEQQRGLLPSMKIAEPANWGERRPTVPEWRSTSTAQTSSRTSSGWPRRGRPGITRCC